MNQQRAIVLSVVILVLTVTPGVIIHVLTNHLDAPKAAEITVTPLRRPVPPSATSAIAPTASRPVEAAASSAPAPMPIEPAVTERSPVRLAADEVVRSLARELSSHAELARWLVDDDLLRRFASAVDMVAGGYSPRDELHFLQPTRAFVVERRPASPAAAPVIGRSSFRRYDLAAEVVSSIDVAGAVALYHHFADDLESAYREVSWYGPPFADRLLDAIDHLLAVEAPSRDLEVVAGAVTWSFADPELEGLSDAQRHLLRTGPDNMRRIQGKLAELRAALEGPVLPGERAPRVATVTDPGRNAPTAAGEASVSP